MSRCFNCKTDLEELGVSINLSMCQQCFQEIDKGIRTVAIGPNALAIRGGIAVGKNAKALGPGALALGDDVEAQAGEKKIGTTLFGMPIEDVLYPDDFEDVVKKLN
jgi:hypothetical protein